MGIFIRELQYNLYSLWTLILLALSSLLTHSGGVEYASRDAVTAAAAELGIATMAQEWAHRTSFAAVGLPLLAVTVVVWFSGSRDRRYRFSSLVNVKPIRTFGLVAARLAAVVCGVLIPHLSGVIAGVLVVGLTQGLWPDFGIFLQSMALNLIPGLTAWVAVVFMATSILPDLKLWVFPVVILWLVLVNVPSTSMFWFYRSIGNPLHPCADPQVWARVVYSFLVAAASFFILLWAVERQRVDQRLPALQQRARRDFSVAQSPLAGRLRLALKITLGAKLPISLLTVTGLAVFLVSPWGILKHQPLEVKQYFTLAFSELLFPLVGLLVTYGIVADQHNMAEIINQRPGGEGKALEQKLVGLSTYLVSTCLVYSLWLHIFLPGLSFLKAFGVLFPSMVALGGLSILIGSFSPSVIWAYASSMGYWGAAYYLQEKFPWFLSPLYHLAEYSFKYRQDLLWKNKTILLVVGTAATVMGLWKTLRHPAQH